MTNRELKLLDIEVAEKILGWRVERVRGEDQDIVHMYPPDKDEKYRSTLSLYDNGTHGFRIPTEGPYPPAPTVSVKQAWKVAEKMQESGYGLYLTYDEFQNKKYVIDFFKAGDFLKPKLYDEVEVGICKAALEAISR